MFTVFALAATFFWTTAYVLIIRQSLRDKVYGMPVVALCLNLSWEFLYTVVYPGDLMATISFASWLILDVVIAWTIVRYGPRQFYRLSPRTFYAGFAVVLAAAPVAILVISAEFDDPMGRYAAFGQNLVMSALFLAMLYHRGSAAGQSLAIGVAKLLGTVNASILSAFFSPAYSGSPLLVFCYLGCFVLDLTYVLAMLRLRHRAMSLGEAHSFRARRRYRSGIRAAQPQRGKLVITSIALLGAEALPARSTAEIVTLFTPTTSGGS